MLEIRYAGIEDVKAVYDLICGLGEYQSMDSTTFCITTEELSKIIEEGSAEVAIAIYDGKPAGIGLYNVMQSGFTGKKNLYLEIFFVEEELRGKGIGTEILRFMAKECVELGYDRIDWVCRTFNTSAMEYYDGVGASKLDDRYWYRMTNSRIREMAGE